MINFSNNLIILDTELIFTGHFQAVFHSGSFQKYNQLIQCGFTSKFFS